MKTIIAILALAAVASATYVYSPVTYSYVPTYSSAYQYHYVQPSYVSSVKYVQPTVSTVSRTETVSPRVHAVTSENHKVHTTSSVVVPSTYQYYYTSPSVYSSSVYSPYVYPQVVYYKK